MQDYPDFYNRLTHTLRDKPRLVAWVNGLNNSITKLIYLLYPLFLAVLFLKWQQAGLSDPIALVKLMPYALIPALSFGLLSMVRSRLNVPRPYERWPITTLIDKDTKGNSMPSRHVFSATIIAMCVLHTYADLGLVLLVLAVLLGFLRVLGGVHYPRDVVAGFVLGVLSGALLWLM